MRYNKAYFQEALDFIRTKTDMVPEIGLILGSGLGTLVTQLENTITIAYQEIPGFLQTTNPSHKGELIFGFLNGKKVVCMSGRFHSYEGFSFSELVIPVRLLKLLGIQILMTTNAAGAVYSSRPCSIICTSPGTSEPITSNKPRVLFLLIFFSELTTSSL